MTTNCHLLTNIECQGWEIQGPECFSFKTPAGCNRPNRLCALSSHRIYEGFLRMEGPSEYSTSLDMLWCWLESVRHADSIKHIVPYISEYQFQDYSSLSLSRCARL